MLKKLIIVIIVFIGIFSIATISASDNITYSDLEVSDVKEDFSIEKMDDFSSLDSNEESESIDPYVEISDEVLIDDYGGSKIVYFSDVSPEASENITMLLDGEKVYCNKLESYQSILLLDLSTQPSYGIHNITISSPGGFYQPFNKTFMVNFTYPFEVYRSYSEDIDKFNFEVYMPSDNTKMINLTLNNKFYGIVNLDENSCFKIDINDLKLGDNILVATYSDLNRPKKSVSCIFQVYPLFNLPDELIFDDSQANVSIRVPVNESGIFELYSVEENNELVLINSTSTVNGFASFNLSKSFNKTNYCVKLIANETDEMYFSLYFVESSELFDAIVPTEANNTAGLTIQLFNLNDDYLCYFDVLVDNQTKINYRFLSGELSVTVPVEPGLHEVIIRPSYSRDIFAPSSSFVRVFHVNVENTTDESSSGGSIWDEIENGLIDLNDLGDDDNPNGNVNSSTNVTNTTSGTENHSNADPPAQDIKTTPVKPTVKTVKKISLSLKSVKIRKSAKKLILTATLKINNKKAKNKLVIFKFKGKTYKKRTNKYGIAKLTIKKSVLKRLKVKKMVTYQVSYGKKTIKKRAVVKK